MLTEVTNPDILSKLNQKPLKEVTDPNLLKQLNSPSKKYNLPNEYFFGHPLTNELSEQIKKQYPEFLQGASQALLNTSEQIANVFGEHLYDKFKYAPTSKASKAGEFTGDIASYFLPGQAIKGAGQIASLLPKGKEAINLLSSILKEHPITNSLLKTAKNFGEAALFQKSKYPKSNLKDILEAGGIGASLPIGIGMFMSNNPLISTLGKLGLGGGLGYYYGGLPGAFEGATAAVTIPKALKEIGIGNTPVSTEFLTEPQNELAQQRYEAAQRLGTPLRPSEAFNSTSIARAEGMIPRSEIGGKQMSQLGQERLIDQKNAISNLLDTIYPKTKKANNEIRNLYESSYQHNMPEDALNSLLDDPLIAQSKKNVSSNPIYQRKLKNIPEDNFAYLDQIKRDLGANVKKSLKIGDDVAATEYKDAQKSLVDEMDKITPDYEKARNASQLKIIRKQLEKVLGNKEATGTNFFNTVLRNDNKYQKLLSDLKNSPEALEKVKNMKLAWQHLIGIETPRSAAGSAARSMTTARNEMIELWNKYKDLFGSPRDIERANFIHSKDWWKKFDEVMSYKNKQQRISELGNLISKSLTPTTLEIEKTRK